MASASTCCPLRWVRWAALGGCLAAWHVLLRAGRGPCGGAGRAVQGSVGAAFPVRLHAGFAHAPLLPLLPCTSPRTPSRASPATCLTPSSSPTSRRPTAQCARCVGTVITTLGCAVAWQHAAWQVVEAAALCTMRGKFVRGVPLFSSVAASAGRRAEAGHAVQKQARRHEPRNTRFHTAPLTPRVTFAIARAARAGRHLPCAWRHAHRGIQGVQATSQAAG